MIANIYLLVFHGSRDERSQSAAAKLTDIVRQELSRHGSGAIVEKAFLELTPIPLHEVIKSLAHRGKIIGASRLYIVPLFLLPGVHVRVDIPAEIKLAGGNTGVELFLCDYLGDYGGIISLMAQKFDGLRGGGRILLSHGTRRTEGIEKVNTLARGLGAAIPAYWAVSPRLETGIETLARRGEKIIHIAPYFLFQGGITDAIAGEVGLLQDKYMGLKLNLLEPLGADVKLARIISEELYGIGDRSISSIGKG
ncbi:MAG: hypothetical protein N5P05_002087 [Chroococcopsis gigantea SAG 12.99]|jgi:sirohydrochlorin cobaltochelatase|nr:sirohydrochlorin chelatase [Chlorogloea purpurea SAG 13.99]MDV3000481.1 hypothetical protein [Chroococcopsis gigantea SAG 12.99]